MLRLNPTKSQFIWFGKTRARCWIDQNALASASLIGQSCDVVRDLGGALDGELTMADHVSRISRTTVVIVSSGRSQLYGERCR